MSNLNNTNNSSHDSSNISNESRSNPLEVDDANYNNVESEFVNPEAETNLEANQEVHISAPNHDYPHDNIESIDSGDVKGVEGVEGVAGNDHHAIDEEIIIEPQRDTQDSFNPIDYDDNDDFLNDTITATESSVNDLDNDQSNDLNIEPPSLPVDITILNEDYTIYCPEGEEEELYAATRDINEFINDLRDEAPMLSPKNLLVLACLNLYEKMSQAKQSASSDTQTLQQANTLVDQMLKDYEHKD